MDTVTRLRYVRAAMPSARVPPGPCPRPAPTAPLATLPYRILRRMSSGSARSAAPALGPVHSGGRSHPGRGVSADGWW